MKYLALALPLAFAACTKPVPPSDVYALASALTAAEHAAMGYLSLPVCPQATAICSDPAIRNKIKLADQTAYQSVKAAEAGAAAGDSVAVTTAMAAVSGLVAAIPAIQVPAAQK